jgi:hypothetical protein
MLQRTLPIFLYFCAITSSTNAQVSTFSSKKYTIEELQEDFNYMRSQIQNKGTVIYLYNTKKETDQYFDSLYQYIKEPMTDIEFFRFIAPIQAFIKDVHTSITPGSTIRTSFFENQHLFPLYVELIHEKVFIEENLSSNPALNDHQEITSINGIPMETIIHTCSLMLPREGYDTGHPLFWLNKNFSYYYYFMYGSSETYQLELKTKEGLKQMETVQGMSIEAIWEIDDKLNPAAESRNVYTKVNDSLKTVILTINTFDDKVIEANHKASFRKLIRAEFDTILKTGYSNLIIDIRNNDGGNSGDGKKVMKYLLKTPFEMKKSVRVVKNKREEDLMKRTRPALYGQFQRGTYKPHKVGFDGDVYVLVNAGSTSAAVVFAATLDRHNRVTFVGTEMGGNPVVMGGGLWDNVKNTPNTKISFSLGNKLNILDNLELNSGHGLIPDHVVEKSYEDFLAGKDSQMLFTLKLIEYK